jgi:hypothetical protein
MFFFTEPGKITGQSPAYGRKDVNEYQITTNFTFSPNAKAVACQNGEIVVVPTTNPNLVNVILKPRSALSIGFPSPRYYIYRGIRKDSFFVSDSTIIPKGSTNSQFLASFWVVIDAWVSLFHSTIPPSPSLLGYSTSLSDATEVALLFSSATPLTGGALNSISEGNWFGIFDASGGFEIVTDEEDIKINLGYLKQLNTVITVAGLPSATDHDKMNIRVKREQILNFIDPAAFWGMHYSQGIYIYDEASSNKKTKLLKGDIYKIALEKFLTKNRVYLDIRSERGYSYNFYRNYGDTTSHFNLRFRIPSTATFTESDYAVDWPIFFYHFGANEKADISKFIIQLRVDDNKKPILFFEDNFIIADQSSPHFADETKLLNGSATDWTKDIVLRFHNVEDLSNPAQLRVYIAGYVQIQYFRQEENTASPPTVLTNFTYLDKVFGAIGDFTLPVTSNLFHYRNAKKGFINAPDYSYVTESGIFFDNDKVILYAKNLYSRKSSTNLYPKFNSRLRNAPLINSPAFPKDILFNKWKLSTTPDEIPICEIAGYNEHNKATPKENLFLLSMSKAQFDQLTALSGFINNHGRYLSLQQNLAILLDLTGLPYTKLNLIVMGLDPSGRKHISQPLTAIEVYTSTYSMFTSIDAANFLMIPEGVPDPVYLSEWPSTGGGEYDNGTVLALQDNYEGPLNGLWTTRKVKLVSTTYYPSDSPGGPISTKQTDFPLIVIVPGNGQNYYDYTDLCIHLARNGFIASAIECRQLTQKGEFDFLTLPATTEFQPYIALGLLQIFTDDSATYFYNPTTNKIHQWVSASPLNVPELPFTIHIDFEIILSGAKIKIINPPSTHGMKPNGRAQVVSEHFKILSTRFGSSVRKNSTGLLGHSRGGEAVLRVAEDIPDTDPFKIKAIMSLAPTDNNQIPISFKKDIPYFVLYGSRDGDTSGRQGNPGSPRGMGFPLFDRVANKSMKSMAFVHRATHNGFNTTNHDYDDFIKDAIDSGVSINPDHKRLLLPGIQKPIFLGYSNAFFRHTLRDEAKWKVIFTGEWIPLSIQIAGHEGIFLQYQAKQNEFKIIDDFQGTVPSAVIVKPSDYNMKPLRVVPVNITKTGDPTGTNGDKSLNSFSPHDTIGVKIKWNTPSNKLTLKFAVGDIGTFKCFSFRIAVHKDDSGKIISGMQVSLDDKYTLFINQNATIPSVDVRANVELPLKRPPLSPVLWNELWNSKSAMMTVRIPLDRFVALGANLGSAQKISLFFPNAGSGEVDVDSFQFTN